MSAERSTPSEPMGPPIDISETIDALCGHFKLDKTMVAQIVFEPSVLTFTVLDPNEHGRPHLRDGEIAKSERSYRVTT